ncbi:hypothetical protein PTTG_28951 [Puccinia triticina 1-1 BBBD Race 1]|uniref:Uncharacterized protein n=1 Tax=Puccinia triticina (isolate 1-1 / race 1 (BBBD)) TaxID=630390 RepID=A0A180G7Y0_PUCT1|nr:hypothetical protein PTTG_28951 [Puccinia triticina 1-1 BBBD Race 1]
MDSTESLPPVQVSKCENQTEEPSAKEPRVKEPSAKEPRVKEPSAKEPCVKEPSVKEPIMPESLPAATDLIPAPLERDFGSRDECYETIQKWAFDHGFAIATARSYSVNGKICVVYQCNKSGPYRPHRTPKEDLEEDTILSPPNSSQKPKSTSTPKTSIKKD